MLINQISKWPRNYISVYSIFYDGFDVEFQIWKYLFKVILIIFHKYIVKH